MPYKLLNVILTLDVRSYIGPYLSMFVTWLQDRSVESESGETNMASVMNSLKKIVKAINPK